MSVSHDSSDRVRGVVINVHGLGATVRIEDGTLAAVPLAELEAHRSIYLRSLERKRTLALVRKLDERGRSRSLRLAEESLEPVDPLPAAEAVELEDDAFEARMAEYLRSTQEWAPLDRPQPSERHFLRKKRRAAHFGAPS